MKKLVAAALVAALFSSTAIAAPKHVAPAVGVKPLVSVNAGVPVLNWDPLGLFSNSSAPQSFSNVVATLNAFTVGDIQNALADAQGFKVAVGGVNYAVGDTVTLGDGVTLLTVTAVSNGAISSVDLTTPGPMLAGVSTSGVVMGASTSGKGTSAQFIENDPIAATCYRALVPIVQAGISNPLPTKLGGFLLFQKGRDAINGLSSIEQNIVNGPINVACSPLILSAQNTIIGLGALVGLKISPLHIPGL